MNHPVRTRKHSQAQLNLWRAVTSAGTYARVQRHAPVESDKPQIIAVASLNNRILTSAITLSIAKLLHAIHTVPAAIVDADGISQPMRRLLGAYHGGDITALATSPSAHLKRRTIEQFADLSSPLPLIAQTVGFSAPIAPETLDTAVRRAQHRWPTTLIDLPYTCPPETIAMGTTIADHTILVTDAHHTDHSWLYRPGHHLSHAAMENRVTVVMIDADARSDHPAGAVALPRPAKTLAKDSESLTMYHQLLTRLRG